MSMFKKNGRRCDVCGKISMNKGGEYVRQDHSAGYITTNEDEGHICTDCASEVLCGDCTERERRAVFHLPPICEEAELMSIEQAVATLNAHKWRGRDDWFYPCETQLVGIPNHETWQIHPTDAQAIAAFCWHKRFQKPQ